MKPRHLIIVLVASGLSAGFLAGLRLSATDGHPTESSDVSRNPSKLKRDAGSTGHAKFAGGTDRHDFRALLRASLRRGPGNADELRELERLDSAALRDLIAGLAAGLGEGWGAEQKATYEVLENACAELYRRDGGKALDWASQLAMGPERKVVFLRLVGAAVLENPVTAKPWVDRIREDYGSPAADLDCDAIISATGRSAEELVSVRKLYGDKLDGFTFPQGSYADDFDFRYLFAEIPPDGGVDMTGAMAYWAAKDPQAAWAEAKESIKTRGGDAIGYFGSLFAGIAVAEGDLKAAEWVAGHLGELPAGLREDAMKSLSRNSRPVATDSGAAMDQLRFSPEARELVNAALQTR